MEMKRSEWRLITQEGKLDVLEGKREVPRGLSRLPMYIAVFQVVLPLNLGALEKDQICQRRSGLTSDIQYCWVIARSETRLLRRQHRKQHTLQGWGQILHSSSFKVTALIFGVVERIRIKDDMHMTWCIKSKH